MAFEDQLPSVLDGILKRIREHLDNDFLALAQELGQLASAERQRLAASAGETAAADARRHTEQQIAHLRDAVRREVDDVRRDAQQQVVEVQRLTDLRLAAAEQQARSAEAARVQQIAQGIASIDDGRSLGDVLERLAHAAAAHAPRTAVFLVRDSGLTEWRRVGFTAPPATTELPLAAAGCLGTAVSLGRPARSDGGVLPPFAGSATDRDAAAFPVTVGGTVVAVLYGDAEKSAGAAWTTMLDVLARYATRVLEAMTMQQATGLWTPRGAARA